MRYSITCFTKILTLATAPFLFNLVLCEVSTGPDVYNLLSPQKEKIHSSF